MYRVTETSRSSWWCPPLHSSAPPASWCRQRASGPHWSHCRQSAGKTRRVSGCRCREGCRWRRRTSSGWLSLSASWHAGKRGAGTAWERPWSVRGWFSPGGCSMLTPSLRTRQHHSYCNKLFQTTGRAVGRAELNPLKFMLRENTKITKSTEDQL